VAIGEDQRQPDRLIRWLSRDPTTLSICPNTWRARIALCSQRDRLRGSPTEPVASSTSAHTTHASSPPRSPACYSHPLSRQRSRRAQRVPPACLCYSRWAHYVGYGFGYYSRCRALTPGSHALSRYSPAHSPRGGGLRPEIFAPETGRGVLWRNSRVSPLQRKLPRHSPTPAIAGAPGTL
jgi:hypothetical protein